MKGGAATHRLGGWFLINLKVMIEHDHPALALFFLLQPIPFSVPLQLMHPVTTLPCSSRIDRAKFIYQLLRALMNGIGEFAVYTTLVARGPRNFKSILRLRF